MVRTEAEITDALKASLRAVEGASVPEDLRSVAFERAFAALTETSGHAGLESSVRSHQDPPAGENSGSSVARMAKKLRIDAALIERVLDFDADGVHITVPRSRLAPQKSGAIQQIALLIVAAKQASGDEEWTPQSLVREASEELGVEDPSNFATHMKRLEGIRARGSGRTGELKMNAVGFEAAAATIRQLGEGGGR